MISAPTSVESSKRRVRIAAVARQETMDLHVDVMMTDRVRPNDSHFVLSVLAQTFAHRAAVHQKVSAVAADRHHRWARTSVVLHVTCGERRPHGIPSIISSRLLRRSNVRNGMN